MGGGIIGADVSDVATCQHNVEEEDEVPLDPDSLEEELYVGAAPVLVNENIIYNGSPYVTSKSGWAFPHVGKVTNTTVHVRNVLRARHGGPSFPPWPYTCWKVSRMRSWA